MTHTQTTYISHIVLRAGKKGARPAEVGALASVFEKSAIDKTKTTRKQKLLKCKQTIQIVKFNVRTLNRISQLPEPIASEKEKKIIWKSNLTDKMKRTFFQAAVMSVLLYGCTTWMLTKRLEKKLDGNYTRMLRAILNKSWQQHPTRRQLYGPLPPVTKTIQARRTRHAGHCWRSKDEIVSDVFPRTPAYGQSKAGRQARTYIQQLCDDTGCNPEDLPEAMNDRETWRERGSGISMLVARYDDDDITSSGH